MTTKLQNSNLRHMRFMRVAFKAVLMMAMIAIVMGAGLAPQTAHAATATWGDIDNRTSPFLISDHNTNSDSVQMFVTEVRVCNPTGATLLDVEANIGDYDSATPANSTPGIFPIVNYTDVGGGNDDYQLSMVATADATRYLGDIAAGACITVFWPIQYPLLSTGTPSGAPLGGTNGSGETLGIIHTFDVWLTAPGETGDVYIEDLQTKQRPTQETSANKLLSTSVVSVSPSGPYFIGDVIEICYGPDNSNVGPNWEDCGPGASDPGYGISQVNDIWIQPTGDPTQWDPNSLRMVGVYADLDTTKCNDGPYNYLDRTYFGAINSGDWDGDGSVEACDKNSQNISGVPYCYSFVATGDGTTTLLPYQQGSSGSNQKYNGDYGLTTTITVQPQCSINLTKSGSPSDVDPGGLITYEIEYENLTSNPVGSFPGAPLEIVDAIPADTAYENGTASCPQGVGLGAVTCQVFYSTDGGTNYSAGNTAPVAADVTHLRFVFEDSIPGNLTAPNFGVGTATYQARVDLAATGGIESGKASSNFSAGAQCSESNKITTTPVTLSFFEATRSGDSVHIEWATVMETGNAGFNIYVETASGRQQVNGEFIESPVIDSFEPVDYTFDASSVAGDVFYIEDVDITGKATEHGPFNIGTAYGVRITVEPIDWGAIHAENEQLTAAREAEAAAAANAEFAKIAAETAVELANTSYLYLPAVTGGQSVEARNSGPVQGAMVQVSAASTTPVSSVDISVTEDGIYQVTYEDFLAAGLDLAGVGNKSLALLNQGYSVPFYPKSPGGSVFGPGAYIEFVGYGWDSLYTKANIYTLVVDSNLSNRVGVDTRKPKNLPLAPYYMETVTVADNNYHSQSASGDDPWFMARLRAPSQGNYGITLDNYVADAAPSTLNVQVWGSTARPETPDHHVVYEFNGQQVADEYFDGISLLSTDVQLPAGSVQDGANTLTIRQPNDTGAKFDYVGLEGYSVTYPRAFAAQDGKLIFKGQGERFLITGLPDSDVLVYRQTGNVVQKVRKVRIEGNAAPFSATFVGSSEMATYMVFSSQALLGAADIQPGRGHTDITSGSAEYLVISHPNFMDGMAPLLAAREAQGLTVKMVNAEDVFDQFGHGIFGPEAIKSYLNHAATNMGTQMVLLVGGDTYDYHNYTMPSISFIPSEHAKISYITNYAPSDPALADLNGDGVPDLAIGRFPVHNTDELTRIVNKTLAYDNKTYDGTAVFTSDAHGDGMFAEDSDLLQSRLPEGWSVVSADIDTLGTTAARATLIDAVNNGVALTSFIGHSGYTTWTFNGLFSSADAAALTNDGKPTVAMQWGCSNSFYQRGTSGTIGLTLLNSGENGAAAVLGNTGIAEASSDFALGLRLTPKMVEPGVPIGYALRDAKAELALSHPEMTDVILGVVLLGDPALVVQQ